MRLETRSDTPQPLFEDIARELFKQLIPTQDVSETLREKISVEGETLQELLNDWVVALLDLIRVQKLVFSSFHITAFKMPEKGPYILQAEALGEHLDPQRHALHPDTPWLACREATVRKENQQYLAEVLLNK
jgi:SHS2 domain-containing protein